MTNECIYNAFFEILKKFPDEEAIFDEKKSLTRFEFDSLINTIASKVPNNMKKIGIIMDHSVEMIASIFAVLKIGAYYVPAEPFLPKERIEFMFDDANVDFVLTSEKFIDKFSNLPYLCIEDGQQIEMVEIPCKAKSNDIAYVLYTSGSTGKPKGVAVTNKNVCSYVKAFNHEFNLRKNDTILQYSVCSFDIFVEEVFTAILSGVRLAIPSAKTKSEFLSVIKFVEKNNVTIISAFPYFVLKINQYKKVPKSVRLIISGGDILRESYIEHIIDSVEIYNTYGPTETTVCCSYFRCNGQQALKDGTYPIGKPILGANILILNQNGDVLPIGEIGEICIEGQGVSNGYIGERYVENKAFQKLPDGRKLYHSGDMGYYLPDGNIVFLNRSDMQTMILGQRVEPIEVENVLYRCSGVQKAVVKPFVDEKKLAYLVAYVVIETDKEVNLSSLKRDMKKFLPDFMIPEFFVVLSDIPVTLNGKVDFSMLPVVLKEGNIVC